MQSDAWGFGALSVLVHVKETLSVAINPFSYPYSYSYPFPYAGSYYCNYCGILVRVP